jgi:hypothetical protein
MHSADARTDSTAIHNGNRSLPRGRPTCHGQAPKSEANAVYWFEHELRQYPPVDLDLDALTDHTEQILPAVGREASGYPAHEVAVVLGRKLGRDVVELPGGHVGCIAHPAEFARELIQALNSKSSPLA